VFLCIFINTISAQTQIAYSAFLLLAIIEPRTVFEKAKDGAMGISHYRQKNKLEKRLSQEGAACDYQIE
jgi:hypothetical protein